MSPELAPPEPQTPAAPSVPEPSRKLPPSARDFDIYEAVQIAGCSTYSQANRHQISQTRVRQIVRRVVEWLGEVLPPQAKVAREQETHLARQIAADRFQHQYQQMTTFWDMTRESKYAGIRLRITTAQARLGAVGGRLDGLAADAIEGIPVPAWQPDIQREGEAPAEPRVGRGSPDAPVGRGSPDPAHPHAAPASGIGVQPHRPDRPSRDQLPEDWDLFTADDLTPEIVAAQAARGRPLGPNLIRAAQENGRNWPRPAADNSTHKDTDTTVDGAAPDPCPPTPCPPPDEDCSSTDKDPPRCPAMADAAAHETPSRTTACDDNPWRSSDTPIDDRATPQLLLIGSTEVTVTQLQITPDQPGATVSPAARCWARVSDPAHAATEGLNNASAVPRPQTPEPSRPAAV